MALVVMNLPAEGMRGTDSIPESGGSPGGGHATHSSILAWRIPMDKGARRAIIHGVTKSRTQLATKHNTAHGEHKVTWPL